MGRMLLSGPTLACKEAPTARQSPAPTGVCKVFDKAAMHLQEFVARSLLQLWWSHMLSS